MKHHKHRLLAALVWGPGCAESVGGTMRDALPEEIVDVTKPAPIDATTPPPIDATKPSPTDAIDEPLAIDGSDAVVEPIDPCAEDAVIDLERVGARVGRTVSYEIPPARPRRRHDLSSSASCGVDEPDNDLVVFRYRARDDAPLVVSLTRFGPARAIYPAVALWQLDACRADAPALRCSNTGRSYWVSVPGFEVRGDITVGSTLYFAARVEPGVWSIAVNALLPLNKTPVSVDASLSGDAAITSAPMCVEPGAAGARPRATEPRCDDGLVVFGDMPLAWQVCARPLEAGETCVPPSRRCDSPRCRDSTCTALDGEYRCRRTGEEAAPCDVAFPCHMGLQCIHGSCVDHAHRLLRRRAKARGYHRVKTGLRRSVRLDSSIEEAHDGEPSPCGSRGL